VLPFPSALLDRLSVALPHVAVIRLEGTIGGRLDPGRYERLFDLLVRMPLTRAVVLEWDSGGGGVSASDHLKTAVQRLAEAKPVVSHIAGVGASGAYMAAVAAQKVTALPTAIVGSIGVISLRPVVDELLRKVGIGFAVTKSGPFKDMGAFYREPTEEERAKEQELVAEFFDDFVAWVAEARGMSEEKVREAATGEIFTGRKALELGLVDEVGDRRRAVAIAAELARIPARAVEVAPRRSLIEQLNPAAMAADMASRIGAAFARGFVEELGARRIR
jgi:protease-4